MALALPSHRDLLARIGNARDHWGPAPPPGVVPQPAAAHEESVWAYPRPPEVRAARGAVRIEQDGAVIAETDAALRICETAGAPVYYLPPTLELMAQLIESPPVTLCEWKGAAVHYDLVTPTGARIAAAAFSYPDPLDDLGQGYARIAGWPAFYPAKVACFVDGVRAAPQPGGLYAGWVTPDIKGPIKGAPGTGHW